MGNMRFKVGDRVRIKNLDWYKENMDEYGHINYGYAQFIPDMSLYCGEVLTICDVEKEFSYYHMKECKYVFMDEMIEGLVEEEVDLIPKFGEYSDNEPLDVLTITTEFVKEHGLPCPEGYIFKDENGNIINTQKIVLEKKGSRYPKTYEECCKVLGIDTLGHSADGYKWEILSTFQNLLICRDAYWKIAGEEMGLGKPWSPSDNNKKPIHAITRYDGYIIKDESGGNDEVLEFPTEEMRDAFYEAFRKEIEICKELL